MSQYIIKKIERVAYTAEILPAIVDFIIDYKRRMDGITPTTREIAAAFEIRSTSTVVQLLEELVADAKLTPIERNGRIVSYRVPGGEWVHNG